MFITDADVNAGDILFETRCGNYDTKHILNLAEEAVEEKMLRTIEEGCPIEVIDELSKKFPICKYKTQITIHGHFPKLEKFRAGGFFGYKNLFQNKNESIGVRWEAIDLKKKEELFKFVRVARKWGVVHNSQKFGIRTFKFVTASNQEEVFDAYMKEAKRIESNKDVFFGGAYVYRCNTLFGTVAVLDITVNAFYEKDFDKVLSVITGIEADECRRLYDEYLEEQRLKREKYKKEVEENRLKREAEIKENIKYNEQWLVDNPCKFPKVRGYTLKVGDVFALPRKGFQYSDDRGKYVGWDYFIVGRAFGKYTMTPCDENGKKGLHRGHEIAKLEGNHWLKPKAIAEKKNDERVEVAKACGCSVISNKEKGGIEIKFDSRPSQDVIDSLKANGFRWSKYGGVWWIKASDKAYEFANSLAKTVAM